jgi:hypothetical protein
MPNKPVWAFPTCSQRALLAWLFHFDHGFSSNETFKQVFAFPVCIRTSLPLLCLLYVEQDVLVYAGYELHLLQKLCCNLSHIYSIIHNTS